MVTRIVYALNLLAVERTFPDGKRVTDLMLFSKTGLIKPTQMVLLRKLMCRAYEDEEEFWRLLKSRKTLLSSGDRNTKFFFASAKCRTARNILYSILDDEGIEHRGDSHIGEVAQDLFSNLYRSELSHQNNHFHVFNEFQNRVTAEIDADLTRKVTQEEEIKQAVFSIGATKAPGPDRFTGDFYHKYWEDIKPSITMEVQNFFERGISELDAEEI